MVESINFSKKSFTMKLKSLLLATFFCLAFTTASQAQFSAGGGLTISFDGDAVGIFGRGAYQFDETWGGMGTFNYYFVENVTFWAIDLDGTYTFLDDGSISAYALAGLSISRVGVNIDSVFGNFSSSNTDLGVSLGGGAKFLVSDSITPFAEGRIRIISSNVDLNISAGVLVSFN